MNIATRLRLFAPGLVLVTAVLVGLAVFWGYRAIVDEQRVRGLTARAEADGSRVTVALQQFQDDLRFLADLPKLFEFAEASRIGDDVVAERSRRQTEDIFVSLLENRPHYDQVRLIGATAEGRELVRVERRDGRVTRVAGDGLQQKGHREYVRESLALPLDRLYISEITLNREQGVLEVPHRPAFRIATPLYDGTGEIFGLAIINLNFTGFIRSLLPIDDGNFDYYLTNADGGYVIHPDPAMAFGFDLGFDNTLQSDYPGVTTLFDTDSDVNVVTASLGAADGAPGLIQARRLFPFYQEPSRFLVLALAAAADTIVVPSQYVGMQVLVVTVVLLVIASTLAFMLASQLTKPIQHLTAAADRVTRREEATFLYKDRDDEIGTLSRALDHMVSSLHRNEESLQDSMRDLEYFTRIASHDLTEPARRIATLANLVQLDESDRLSADGRETLGRLRGEGLTMVQQLTDLRAFARLGRSDLVREEIDLQVLIDRVIAAHSGEIDRRRVAVRSDPMPKLSVYIRLVEMLYHNLVDNAFQHTAVDGFELEFSCAKSGDRYVFGVSNTGSEITGDPESLFDPFHTGSSDSGRSGLGLSICRRIVERHAGRIWVAPEENRVRFLFTLGTGDQ